MVGTNDDGLLPPSVVRQIGDKLYEKRKVAALEVEQILKRLAASNDQNKIKAIIDTIVTQYAFSPQSNLRKGALLCLAAATVGLGEPTETHLRQIVPPVLNCFTDQDSRVRYYACEALYNIAKVARESFIIFFSETFDAMFRLCADSETNVQSAVQFLDNLIKDIVTASSSFNVEGFIPKLRDYMRVLNPYKRQFLISWVTVLDSVPELDMLTYLPELLDGLMTMLADPNREIRMAAHKCMQEFLVEIQASRAVDFTALCKILVEKANSQDEFTRQQALKWLKEFVEMASGQLLDSYAEILGAVLPNISHDSHDIQQVASEANNALLQLPPTLPGSGKLDTPAILTTISRELQSEQEPTRLEAIRWIHFLLKRNQQEVFDSMSSVLPALLDALSATSERVVMQALSVLAAVAINPQQFSPILKSLLSRFRGEQGLGVLQKGGSLVIRRICVYMGPERVFKELASVLDEEQDLRFASTMVQALHLLLLTAPELKLLRELLREAPQQPQGAALFSALYACWSHSTGALLGLCFLAQAYGHACDIIGSFGQLPLGAEVLVQVDRLVQLLETPSYTFLRLQLLQPARHPALLKAMYGLLMLLPQSNAFRTLHVRLHSIPTLTMLQLDSASGTQAPGADSAEGWAEFSTLLAGFVARQVLHAADEERRLTAAEGVPAPDEDAAAAAAATAAAPPSTGKASAAATADGPLQSSGGSGAQVIGRASPDSDL